MKAVDKDVALFEVNVRSKMSGKISTRLQPTTSCLLVYINLFLIYLLVTGIHT